MNAHRQMGYEQEWAQPYGPAPVIGARGALGGAVWVALGLALGAIFLPFLWIFAERSDVLGLGGIIVFLVPLGAGPLWMLGFQRPVFGVILAVALGILDWRLGERFALFGQVWGITSNPSSIFFMLVFLQSFTWRTRRRVPGILLVYVFLTMVGGGMGLLVTADADATTEALIMRLVIPALITINAIRTLDRPEDLELLWLGVLVVALVAVVYNMNLGLSRRHWGAIQMGGNSFALACVCLLPIVVEWGLSHHRQFYRWTGRVASLMLGTQIWFESSRTAITLTALFVVATLVTKFRRIVFSPLYLTMIVLAVALGLGWVAKSRLAEVGGQTQFERFQRLLEGGLRGSNRWAVWTEATELIASSPVLGKGMNAIWTASVLKARHAHQIMLSMWLDTGLLGLMVFIMLTIYLPYALFTRMRRAPPGPLKNICRVALAMFFMNFLSLQVEGYLYCGKYMIGTWIFHLVVISSFVAVALVDERRGADYEL